MLHDMPTLSKKATWGWTQKVVKQQDGFSTPSANPCMVVHVADSGRV